MEVIVAIVLLVTLGQTVLLRLLLRKWAGRWAHVAPQFPATWHFAMLVALNIYIVVDASRASEVVAAVLMAPLYAFLIFAVLYYWDVRRIRKGKLSLWGAW